MSLLDKLPKSPFHKRQDQGEYYFSLNIDSNTLTASVWGIVNKKLEIINVAQLSYENRSDIPELANKALDEALQDFSPEPNKILFGVPDGWLDQENLKEEDLKLLKHLVKELDVVPMAYVSTNFAIAHLHQKTSGVPLTGILVNVEDPVNVVVAKAGKVLASVYADKEGDLANKIEKALAGLSIEVLPSKIILFSSRMGDLELEKLRSDVQKFPWINNLPFLHLPKVEVLERSTPIQAICLAGALEVDPDVSFNLSKIDLGQSDSLVPDALTEESNLASIGFVDGEEEDLIDQTEELLPTQDNRSNELAEPEEGFMDDEGEPQELAPFVSHSEQEISSHPRNYLNRRPLNDIKSTGLIGSAMGVLSQFRLPSKMPQLSLGLLTNKFALIFVGVLLALVAAYIALPKAQVTIFVDPKVLENSAQVIADPSISVVDEANKKIPGKITETDISGSDTGSATGHKKIGDKAKGRVLLYNKTSSPKSFAAGTILNAGSSVNYILDSSVTVASQSAVEGGISFGKSTAQVTASDIGPEGNLSSGKDLTIKGESNSNASAKVDQDINGGTSKEVTVVTSDDQKKLLAKLTGDLRKKAQGDIQGKLTGDSKILSEALIETIGKTSYSKAIGDQATDFTLNLTVHYRGIAYSESDLKSIVSKLVETNVPAGFELSLADTDTQADVLKAEKDKITFQAKFKAKLFPKLDIEKIKKDIAGKTFAQVTEIVRRSENVIDSQVKTSLLLPSSLQRLPILAKNITIEVLPR